MSLSNNFPVNSSNLNLSLANAGRLDPRVTFTRASTGTYYDGYSSAKAEENLLLQSQTFSSASWSKTNVTETSDTTAAPDGTTTADTLLFAGGGLLSGIFQTPISYVSGFVYTQSVFAKYIDQQWIQMTFGSAAFGSSQYANFDIQNGVVGGVAGGTASIVSVGNNWYRCIFTATATSTASSTGGQVTGIDGTGAIRNATLTASSTSVYIWGAQLEQRSSVTSYTATTTASITNYIPVLQTAAADVPRFDHNPTTRAALGLLVEEQRANLVTYSADFANAAWTKGAASITSNTIVAPDGTLTGDKLVEDTATNTHLVQPSISPSYTSGTTYTYSVFAKAAERTFLQLRVTASSQFSASFNLSNGTASQQSAGTTAEITAVGNGWYRCAITFAANATAAGASRIGVMFDATTQSYTGDGYSGIYLWGAQLEAGAFPTSYIATTSASVTRNADVASMTGTNFSAWYNQTEGTIYVDAARGADVDATIATIAVGATTADRIQIHSTNASEYRATYRTGNVEQAALLMASSTNAPKIAATIKTNDLATSINGAAAVTDTSATLATYDTFYIGARSDSTIYWNGTIRNLRYYPVRNSDAQLQALTG